MGIALFLKILTEFCSGSIPKLNSSIEYIIMYGNKTYIKECFRLANISITLDGIDQAIAGLNYKDGTVKAKAVMAIRSFYASEDAVKNLNSIDSDTLIRSIWEVEDDPSKIKAKRRNFFSIKSSINADLATLSKKGLNSENIIITESNIFDMTEEAKSNLLSSFSDAVKTGGINLDQAADLLKAISDFLENLPMEKKDSDSKDIVSQIQKILKKMTEETLAEDDEEIEEIELDEDEEIEEVEDIEEIELEDDQEIEEEIDAEELVEDEEIEEVEVLNEDDEEIEEIELDEDEALEEIDELDEDELKALEEFRQKKELAEHFDETLGDREKKYNKYTTVPEGKYTIGTRKSLKSSLELQEFDMPRVYIGIYPVTNALFEIFIEETGYITTAEQKGFGRVFHSRFKKNEKGSVWKKS